MGGEGGGQAVHVVNIDIQDNHEEATIGAFLFNELVSRVYLLTGANGFLLRFIFWLL